MSVTPLPTSTPYAETAREWLTTAQFTDPTDALARINTAALAAARGLAAGAVAVDVSLAPGNMTSHDMILTRLSADAESRFGGNLLIAMPQHRLSIAVYLPGMLFPSYVAEKTPFRGTDAATLAAFATLLSARLDAAGVTLN